MKESIKKGLSFGLTSGIITTLGLIIGLYSSTESKLAVIGGVLVIAIADSLSDATGMHISSEEDKRISNKDVWRSTFATLFSKFIFAMSFIIPLLLFNLFTAVVVSLIWGFVLISILSYYIAKTRKSSVFKAISEHITIAITVVVLTYLVGKFVGIYFG